MPRDERNARRQLTPPAAGQGLDGKAVRSKPCPHFPACVGCAFIGLPYGEQLQRKRETLRLALARYPALAALAIPPVVGSPHAFGYRNQAKLVTRCTRRGLLLGIYRPGTHQVVDISACPVHHPFIEAALAQVRSALERLQVPTYDERVGSGWLRYLVLRASTLQKSVQIILVVRDRAFAGEQALVRALRRIPRVRSLVINLNPSPGNVIFGETFLALTKEQALIERVGDWQLKSHAGSFLQANIGAARRVYERVATWADAGADDVAVDLYAGVGAISFHLAARAKRVYGIEESPIAVLDAKENIRINGVHNVRFYAGKVADELPALAQQIGRIDLITLNPPRKGVDEATREAIVRCSPSRIVYVACEPTSLARDLAWFADHGYPTAQVQPFDLLPQTEHSESVALLRKVES